jgi:HPt (histidine-containing phosphotransfer) domain-containing protein
MTIWDLDDELLYSDLAADPDLAELVELFVRELPTRLADLRAAIASGDFTTVRRLAHQLKGAGGSHGFPQLGPPAWKVEQAATQVDAGGATAALEELIAVCGRTRAGRPG